MMRFEWCGVRRLGNSPGCLLYGVESSHEDSRNGSGAALRQLGLAAAYLPVNLPVLKAAGRRPSSRVDRLTGRPP